MAKRSNSQQELVASLSVVLADTYVLAVKTHGFHWNVTGSLFAPLHEFFGKEYDALLLAADELAERVRALGAVAPSGMTQLLALSRVKDVGSKSLTAKEMLADLVAAHEVCLSGIRAARIAADSAEDGVTDDMLIERHTAHDKTLWMLRAQLA